ncbi:unnamed protein product [Phytophthora fragariaefolia]|uniref:Unnamed protein product n=1 Tax=Phytophthora fragariaefolia TaxID=1490495 RepID=A0A9W6XI83_9STRA|nr:unnamed protein product [Phytophthora fragariaefolia]
MRAWDRISGESRKCGKGKASSKASGLSSKIKRRRLEAHDGMPASLDVKLISTSNSKIDQRVQQRKREMMETSPTCILVDVTGRQSSTIALMVASKGEKDKVSDTNNSVPNGVNNVVITGADYGALMSSNVCKHNHFIDKDIYRALCRGEAVDAFEFLCAETGALISKMLDIYHAHLVCLDQIVISQINMCEIIVKHAMEGLTLNGNLLELLQIRGSTRKLQFCSS